MKNHDTTDTHRIWIVWAVVLALAPQMALWGREAARLVPLFTLTSAAIVQPVDVFVDETAGEIYVASSGTGRVTVYDREGFYRYQFTAPGNGNGLSSVAVNRRGEILVVVAGKVMICDFRGSFLEYPRYEGLPDDEAIVATRIKIDREDNYYLIAQNRLLVFDPDWNYRFAVGVKDIPPSSAPKARELRIGDVSIDDDGNIYIVDFMASFVYLFDRKGRFIRSVGEPGGTFDTLSFPTGVAVDRQGRILVVDSASHGVLAYDRKGTLLFAVGGLGRSEGRFYFPKTITTDRSGRIYVIEPALNRVQVLTIETPSDDHSLKAARPSDRTPSPNEPPRAGRGEEFGRQHVSNRLSPKHVRRI